MASGTCAENCWYAREQVCACQCDGRNHGIMLTAGGETPVRTKRVKDRVYKMISIHTSNYEAERAASRFSWGGDEFKYDRNRDSKVTTVYADKCAWPEVEPFYGGNWNCAYIVWGWVRDA